MADQKDTLLSYFKEANQILRKRAITLGVLMMVTIGLTYTESNRMENVGALLNYQSKLEHTMNVPDTTFSREIQDDFQADFQDYGNPYYFDRYRLFNKVRTHDMDRSFIETAIEDIDKKIDQQNEEKAISILGLTIPLKPVVYLGMLIILVLFHDFTQTMIYRNDLSRQIRRLNVSSWELGVEFFGSNHQSNQASLKFLRLTTGMVTGFLILCPLITSFMILDLNNSNSELVALSNITGFSIVIIDTIIVFYTVNIWGFRAFSNRYLGNTKVNIRKLRFIWLATLCTMVYFQALVGYDLPGEYARAGFDYFVLSVIPIIALYISLEICHKKRTELWRAIRAGLLILNIFWFYSTLNLSLSYFPLSHSRVIDFYGFLGISTLISLAVSFVYIKFFIIKSTRTEAVGQNN